MKKFHLLLNGSVMLALILSVLITAAPASAQDGGGVQRFEIAYDENGAPYVAGQVVVTIKKPTTRRTTILSAAKSTASEAEATVNRVTTSGMVLMNIPAGSEEEKIDFLLEQDNVIDAELNYILSLPPVDGGAPTETNYILRAPGEQVVPVDDLTAMKTKRGARTLATYPNDPYLWNNAGWAWVGADILTGYTAASAGVCVLDTGVDYLHPDLGTNILKGYDYVNGDADPMDDNGHGTHVAGIISAKINNKIGLAGVSTGRVIAVKVADAMGYATNFELAAGIEYCSKRTDVRVINISLGAPLRSDMVYNKLLDATAYPGRNKLVVVASGNEYAAIGDYPAYFITETGLDGNQLLAVASSGVDVDPDGIPDNGDEYIDYSCQADQTNYAEWISVAAPGYNITSTTPYRKPFYWYYQAGFSGEGYNTMSGTSMAAAFVSAAAARYWGTAARINTDVGAAVKASGAQVVADGTCWGTEFEATESKFHVNVAKLLNRGALRAGVYDAASGLPLPGATVAVYSGAYLRGSAATVANVQVTDVVNIPAGVGYVLKVNKAGYTYGYQLAFQHLGSSGQIAIEPGEWLDAGDTAVPPKTVYFNVVGGSVYEPCSGCVNDHSDKNLDLYLWLPEPPTIDLTQTYKFIVGDDFGNTFTSINDDSAGYLFDQPFARLKTTSSIGDLPVFQTITLRSRAAHGGLALNNGLPYYPGTYTVRLNGPTVDTGIGTYPSLGIYHLPYVYVWKDGFVKNFVRMANAAIPTAPGGTCNTEWWTALQFTSGATGLAPVYDITMTTDPAGPTFGPYGCSANPNLPY